MKESFLYYLCYYVCVRLCKYHHKNIKIHNNIMESNESPREIKVLQMIVKRVIIQQMKVIDIGLFLSKDIKYLVHQNDFLNHLVNQNN